MTNPAAETKSIGLPADELLSSLPRPKRRGFLLIHIDSPGLGTAGLFHRAPGLFIHLPGLAKTKPPRPFVSALGRLRRQLTKPPGR